MKTHLKLVILLLSIWVNTITASAQAPPYDKNWELVPSKSDEFNSSILDSNKWLRITGKKWGPSIFTTSHVILPDTILRLRASKVDTTYYTGGIESANYNYTYGYYEISVKTPCGAGFWPAFWLYAADSATHKYNEIDILEPDGCQSANNDRNVAGIWAIMPDSIDQDKVFTSDQTNLPSLCTSYHKFAVEWLPDRVNFYFDDRPKAFSLVHKLYIPSLLLRVLIDLQIGNGNYGECLPNTANLPKYMEVDFFRYYKMNAACSTVINQSSFNFSNANSIKKSYTITSSTVPSGFHTTLRATDFIELGNNFEIPASTEFNAVITECL